MIKLLSVVWANQMGVPAMLGIVSTENDEGEKKIYMGTAGGINEEEDTKRIMTHGGRVSPEQLQQLIDTVTK